MLKFDNYTSLTPKYEVFVEWQDLLRSTKLETLGISLIWGNLFFNLSKGSFILYTCDILASFQQLAKEIVTSVFIGLGC